LGIFLLGCVFFLGLSLKAQLAYEGRVLDSKTGQPIPFVNIGVLNRGIGTVTNAEGEFLLQFYPREVGKGDVLRLSSLGYLPQEIPLERLNPRVAEFTFRLQPDPIALQEVVVTDKALLEAEETHGYPDLLGKGIGYWKDSVALGGELASRIRLRKGLYRLNSLFFHTLENPSDSLLLRINLYSPDSKAGIPGENLNKSGRNILHTLPASKIFSVIDLRPFDIWARNDVIVSLELLGVYGSKLVGLTLPAGKYPNGKSFRRYASQDSWESIDGAVVGFSLQTTLFTDNPRRLPSKRTVRKRKKVEREISGKVFRQGSSLPGFSDTYPIRGASVRNYTRNQVVETDKWGRFRIRVARGDVLGVFHPYYHAIFIEIEEPENLNFLLRRTNELLWD
jgi:hypothetical protein